MRRAGPGVQDCPGSWLRGPSTISRDMQGGGAQPLPLLSDHGGHVLNGGTPGKLLPGGLPAPPTVARVKAHVPRGSCSPAPQPGEPGGTGWRPSQLSTPEGLAR